MKTLCFISMMALGLFMSSFTSLDATVSVVEDQLIQGCTATVTFQGEVVDTFTETGTNAYTKAYARACDYIENQGGTCPRQ